MAMIECPECGKEISDKAKSCPNCGYPIENYYDDEEYEDEDEDEDEDDYEREITSAKHIYECTCHCLNCGKEFSYTNVDIARNKNGRWDDLASMQNRMAGSNIERAIALNHNQKSYQADFNKCPNCGSRKLEKEFDNYYIDQNGEYIEDYEPSVFEKIGEFIKSIFVLLGDIFHKVCLIITILPLIIIIWLIIQLLFIFF